MKVCPSLVGFVVVCCIVVAAVTKRPRLDNIYRKKGMVHSVRGLLSSGRAF